MQPVRNCTRKMLRFEDIHIHLWLLVQLFAPFCNLTQSSSEHNQTNPPPPGTASFLPPREPTRVAAVFKSSHVGDPVFRGQLPLISPDIYLDRDPIIYPYRVAPLSRGGSRQGWAPVWSNGLTGHYRGMGNQTRGVEVKLSRGEQERGESLSLSTPPSYQGRPAWGQSSRGRSVRGRPARGLVGAEVGRAGGGVCSRKHWQWDPSRDCDS